MTSSLIFTESEIWVKEYVDKNLQICMKGITAAIYIWTTLS